MHNFLLLADQRIADARVIVRADLNVPLVDNMIEDDFRLLAVRPTLDYLLARQCTITLITHLGGTAADKPHPTSALLLDWFKQHQYPTVFAPDIQTAYQLSNSLSGTIILLENLRRWPQEVADDIPFAKELSTLGDYFVQDAFGALHEKNSSIAVTPQFFAVEKRFIGFLVAQELNMLTPLKSEPAQPFCCIIGGNKVAKKVKFIADIAHNAEQILLCPALVFSYMHAAGNNVGRSLIDAAAQPACVKLHNEVKNLVLPTDYLVATSTDLNDLRTINTDSFTPHEQGISLGPKTVAHFSDIVKQAKTVFLNGAFGFADHPNTLTPMNNIISAMAQVNGTTVIAGGDSVAIARKHPLVDRISHLSTGGGSALAYISGQELPGLKAMKVANLASKNGAET